jgi:hypothetical protein
MRRSSVVAPSPDGRWHGLASGSGGTVPFFLGQLDTNTKREDRMAVRLGGVNMP